MAGYVGYHSTEFGARKGSRGKRRKQGKAELEKEKKELEEEVEKLEEEKGELWKEKKEEEERRRTVEKKNRQLGIEIVQLEFELKNCADASTISRLKKKIANLQDSINLSAQALKAGRPGQGNLYRRSRAPDMKK